MQFQPESKEHQSCDSIQQFCVLKEKKNCLETNAHSFILGFYFLQAPTRAIDLIMYEKKRVRERNQTRRGGVRRLQQDCIHTQNYPASMAPIYFNWTWLLSV